MYIWKGRHWGIHEKSPCLSLLWVHVIEILRSGGQVQCSPWELNGDLSKKVIHGFSDLKTLLPGDESVRRSLFCALTSSVPPLTPARLPFLTQTYLLTQERKQRLFLDMHEPPMKLRGFTCVYRRIIQLLFSCYIKCSLIFPEIQFYDHFPPVLQLCTVGLI